MRTQGLAFCVFFLVAAGCAEESRGKNPAPTPTAPGMPTNPTLPGPTLNEADMLVYGHSSSTLYTVDPDSYQVDKIGDFIWPSGSDEMTDIAIDGKGNMIGVSYSRIYSVDKTNARCTFLSNFSGSNFNGLSFIYAHVGDGTEEILVAAAGDGGLYKINPMTGAQSWFGDYGAGWSSSGDLVSVKNATYATVYGDGLDFGDSLVKVDPTTGAATKIGKTGFSGIYGLGYWRQKVFGFSELGALLILDINDGHATQVSNDGISWWGAGVTTAAPIDVL
jgi:hypothetical protein